MGTLKLTERDSPGLRDLLHHRATNGFFVFSAYGRITVTRDGGVQTFYSKKYAEKSGWHKKNSYCVCFTENGTKKYGLVDIWLKDNAPNNESVYALINPLTSPTQVGGPLQNDDDNDMLFIRNARAVPVIVNVSCVLYKCIFSDLGNQQVAGVQLCRVTLLVHRAENAYNDLFDADHNAAVEDELM